MNSIIKSTINNNLGDIDEYTYTITLPHSMMKTEGVASYVHQSYVVSAMIVVLQCGCIWLSFLRK